MITDGHVWNWQVWEVLKDQTRKWVGFFKDERTALEWKRTQKGRNLLINNVPPARVEQPIFDLGGTYESQPKAGRAKGGSRRTAMDRVYDAPVQVLPEPETKEQKALRKQAQKRLDKHLKDEAAEMVAEQG